jgi:hypothetical protein
MHTSQFNIRWIAAGRLAGPPCRPAVRLESLTYNLGTRLAPSLPRSWAGLAGACGKARRGQAGPGKTRHLVFGCLADQTGRAGQKAATHNLGEGAERGKARPWATGGATAPHTRLAGNVGKTRQRRARAGGRRKKASLLLIYWKLAGRRLSLLRTGRRGPAAFPRKFEAGEACGHWHSLCVSIRRTFCLKTVDIATPATKKLPVG